MFPCRDVTLCYIGSFLDLLDIPNIPGNTCALCGACVLLWSTETWKSWHVVRCGYWEERWCFRYLNLRRWAVRWKLTILSDTALAKIGFAMFCLGRRFTNPPHLTEASQEGQAARVGPLHGFRGQVDFLHEKGFLVVEHRDTYMDEAPTSVGFLTHQQLQQRLMFPTWSRPTTMRYPLVMTDIAIENDHRHSGFSHEKWWIFP